MAGEATIPLSGYVVDGRTDAVVGGPVALRGRLEALGWAAKVVADDGTAMAYVQRFDFTEVSPHPDFGRSLAPAWFVVQCQADGCGQLVIVHQGYGGHGTDFDNRRDPAGEVALEENDVQPGELCEKCSDPFCEDHATDQDARGDDGSGQWVTDLGFVACFPCAEAPPEGDDCFDA